MPDPLSLLGNMALLTAEQQRTPTSFKTTGLAPAGGATATVWTPTAGKRFRLMGFIATAPMNAAGATNEIDLNLTDSGGGTIATWRVFVPTTPVTTTPGNLVIAKLIIPGNGYLAAAVSSPLTASVSAILTNGTLRFIAWGCEE